MRTSLRTRLTVTFIGLAILPLVLMGLVLARQSFVVQQQQALSMQGEVARRVATAVDAFVRGLESELRIVAEVERIADRAPTEQENLLAGLLAYQGSFAELTLLDSQGSEQIRLARLRSVSPGELAERSQADEFRIPMQTLQTYYSPIRFDQVLGEPLMTIAVPLVNPNNGQAEGVLVADGRLKRMWDVIAEIPVSAGESVYIVSQEGRVIAHRKPSTVLRGVYFDVPAQDGVHAGLDEPRVILATEPIRLGDQVLDVVAEKATSEALNLATSTLTVTGILTVAALILAGGLGLLMVSRIVRPIEALESVAEAVAAGDLARQATAHRRDEIGRLAAAFNSMTAQLRETLTGLEQRVAERTHDAEHRALQLQAAAEVGRAITSIRDLDELLTEVTRLIGDRFGFYHVGIFMLDPEGDHAVLRAASSAGGQLMLARGHRLAVGEASIVGHVMDRREPRIALDVGQDSVFFNNPDLPNTRSELAMPLSSGGKLLGALDVQSTEAGAFSAEDVDVLRVLADQVAVAIENARLFAESQRALEVERRLYGRLSREAWREILRIRQALGYRSDPQGVYAIHPQEGPGAVPSSDTGQVLQDGSTLILPIRIRDQELGVVRLRKPDEAGKWTEDETALMEALTEQLSLALESARLYDDTQRRAAREQLVGEITSRMRETLDVETVLQTALREMGTALGIPKIQVRLGGAVAHPTAGGGQVEKGNGHGDPD